MGGGPKARHKPAQRKTASFAVAALGSPSAQTRGEGEPARVADRRGRGKPQPPNVENPSAHFYFATLVIEKACEGREAGFVKSWLDEIRRTPRDRANSGTVLAAYRKLTGKDLKDIIGEVVK